MKTTLLTTILSAAALSLAIFASPASAQTCGCQRSAPPVVYQQRAPIDDSYYGDDDYDYGYDSTQVVIEEPYGFWEGGYWGNHYFVRGWYHGTRGWDNRGWDNRGGQRFYGRPNGGGYGHFDGGRGHAGGGRGHR